MQGKVCVDGGGCGRYWFTVFGDAVAAVAFVPAGASLSIMNFFSHCVTATTSHITVTLLAVVLLGVVGMRR